MTDSIKLPLDRETIERVAKALHKQRYGERAIPWDEMKRDLTAHSMWQRDAVKFIKAFNEAV